MRVRIGIVSWNTAGLLADCLAALPEAALGLDYDVVVVDNASSDDSVAVARRAGVTVVANGENTGYARGMNQALLQPTDGAAPHVLVALNPDTVPEPGSLTELVHRLVDDPTAGLAVPLLLNPDGTQQHSVYRYPSPRITAIICLVPLRFQRGRMARHWWLEGRAPHDTAGAIDWAIGAVHAIRVDALAGELPYTERWFMYVEDLDLCWRMNQRGWRCKLEPSARVMHVGNAAGAQAWGSGRTARWWQATYDWCRFRRGVAPVFLYATVNTLGVAFMLWRTRLLRALLGKRAPEEMNGRIVDLTAILPTHATMARHPATTYIPPPNGVTAPANVR